VSERATLWNPSRVRARKRHTCDGCREPICVGTVHDRIGRLSDGGWDTLRVHLECHELARELADPDEGTYFVEYLLEQVRDRVSCGETDLVRRWLGLRRARLREQRGRASLCVDAPAAWAEETGWPVGERCAFPWSHGASRCIVQMRGPGWGVTNYDDVRHG
jgi:hypothetical protein